MSNTSAFIFEVSRNSFDTSVIQNSHKIPVLVEFMGVWSGPCIQMSETLAVLATEFAGQFVFARVDIDEQTELVKEYDVKNVPTLKVFKDGQVVQSEEGQLHQEELRALLKGYGIYHASDELRQQAREQHISGNTVQAIQLLTEAIQQDPGNTRVAMDMVQIFLDINELEQAVGLFNKLPDSDKNSDTGKALIGQLTFRNLAAKTEGKAVLQERVMMVPDDNDARFDLAICLVAEHDYDQAMDALFVILDQDNEYKDGAAREMIIKLIDTLAPNNAEMAQRYRRRLGAAMA